MYSNKDQEFRAFKRFRENVAADKCPICCEEKPNIITVCCGKGVCITCLTKWLSRNESCPQCRAQITFCPTSRPVETQGLQSSIQSRPTSSSITPYNPLFSHITSYDSRWNELRPELESRDRERTALLLSELTSRRSALRNARLVNTLRQPAVSIPHTISLLSLQSSNISSSSDFTSPSFTNTNELQSRATAHMQHTLSNINGNPLPPNIMSSLFDDTSPLLQNTNELRRRGKIIISGAGLTTVNGAYTYSGIFDTVARYSKRGMWKNSEVTFSLFRCRLNDYTKRWYISIVPKNIQPGTNKDTDFYKATATCDPNELPISIMWMTAKEGIDPAPNSYRIFT